MVARLYRMIPLAIALAVAALVVYFVVSWRRSPNRAKEVLITWFTWLTLGLSAAFALVSLYALLDGNLFAFDIAASFLVVTLAALVIVRICRAVFVKNHPQYAKRAQKATKRRRLR